MIQNYFKTAWRHIIRHKRYSAINVVGLALGICGCLVIYLIANFEFSFDTFHPDKDRIYCVDASISGGSSGHGHGDDHLNSVPAPMPDAMRREMSGLEKVAAFQHYNARVKIKAGDKTIKTFDGAEGVIIEPDYFDILPYTWLSGNSKTALSQPFTVVLTQSRAQTYFGDLPPEEMIGKTITYGDSLIVKVTGILQDWNKNSNFNFTDFISYSTIQSSFLKHQFQLDNWFNLDSDSQELLKLPSNVSPSTIDAQFPAFVKRHLDPDPNTKLHIKLQSFTSIHFHHEYGGGGVKADLSVLYILSAIAIFILLIAAVNFINLSTALSIQRTKEIGIRKVLGSGRKAILFQFLTETFTLALLAVGIAVVAVQPLLKLFANYIPQGLNFQIANHSTWLFLIGIAVFTTLLAGLYPAKLLSAFRAVSSLKGEAKNNGQKRYLRKSLIVFQFTLSLIFIIGTIVIAKQLDYMQTQDLGFKPNSIITLRSLWNDQTGKMKVLAEKLKQEPGIYQVIIEAFPPMGLAHMGNGIRLQGSSEQPMEVSVHAGNEYYVPFYGMKIVAGRNLFHSDSVGEYLVNETAVRALGFNNPRQAIGKLLILGEKKQALPIVGVVADFYENSFHQHIMPIVIANDPKVENGIALKLSAAEFQKGDIQKLVSGIEKEWKNVYPEEPFEYSFLGDSIARLYESDQQTQWLMKTATLITIFISCMGLFGLAMFTTEKRTKEIGIRKVIGAGVTNILYMLSREIIALVAISLCVASPVAGFFMQKWLQGFAYRTHINLWTYILAGCGALFIALATISYQAIKAASANPVNSLRSE